MRVAVLDLGTNTFNLIVAESAHAAGFRILHNTKLGVKLGEGGIASGEILPGAFERGIRAVEQHYQTLRSFGVTRVQAFGTSALRTARNGGEFLEAIYRKTGIEVQIISGDREAELIYHGVRQTYAMHNEKHLILDIGGGSNEFIIADGQCLYWKKSYPLGIARLLDRFKPSDPLGDEEIARVVAYIENELADLEPEVKQHSVTKLIGASGSFETFTALIRSSANYETESALEACAVPILPETFDELYRRLIRSTVEERSRMPGLEPLRIEMIVLAALFVKFVMDRFNLKQIIQSNFALKEGAVSEMLMAQ